ncbi:hypothetical protein [Rugosimonospora africana]|uniref:Uncharacterized protein n=1 Tax=Rugosimonospora africana TaxID=556532 RepID=A0A8J3R4S8_9ACTN|nr:hypothetical protein [Rugosimonospora africana]GIH21683.1 hypothetical protein Raf01_98550 [Rugosimonospora africana]
MVEMARPLPERDVHVLFDVLVVLEGELLSGQFSRDVMAHVMRRLANDGLLAGDASVGEFTAAVGDLVLRLRYALGEYPELPEPWPRETTYLLRLPNPEVARLCEEQLVAWGGSAVTVCGVERGSEWEVRATFAELAPDPSHDERGVQLVRLAGEYGGRYEGWRP